MSGVFFTQSGKSISILKKLFTLKSWTRICDVTVYSLPPFVPSPIMCARVSIRLYGTSPQTCVCVFMRLQMRACSCISAFSHRCTTVAIIKSTVGCPSSLSVGLLGTKREIHVHVSIECVIWQYVSLSVGEMPEIRKVVESCPHVIRTFLGHKERYIFERLCPNTPCGLMGTPFMVQARQEKLERSLQELLAERQIAYQVLQERLETKSIL